MKLGTLQVLWLVLDLDAADFVGEDLVVHLAVHDVLVFEHRPVGAVWAGRDVVDRVFGPQAVEVGAPGVVLVELGIGDVEPVQRQSGGRAGRVDMDGRVHFGLPYWRVGQHGERVASIAAPLFSGRCDLVDGPISEFLER